jgi:chaperonin GroES
VETAVTNTQDLGSKAMESAEAGPGAEATEDRDAEVQPPTTDDGSSGPARGHHGGDKVGDDNETEGGSRSVTGSRSSSHTTEGLPIKMLHDRILVKLESADGDRRSSGGILIPATAQVGKRLTWAQVVAAGPSVRSMELGDRVLFNPEDRYEVEVGGQDYIILRERDIHAVAAERLTESPMGLYL